MNERSHILSAPSHSPWSTPSPVRAEGGSFTLHGLWLCGSPAGPQRSLAKCSCFSWVLGEDIGKDRVPCPGRLWPHDLI